MSLKPLHSAVVLSGKVRICAEHMTERDEYSYSVRCSALINDQHATCVVELDDPNQKIKNAFLPATLHFIYDVHIDDSQQEIGLYAGEKKILEFSKCPTQKLYAE